MDKKIKVTISPLGIAKVEAIGYEGIGCKEATKNIIGALGGGAGANIELKPEASIITTETSTEQTLSN